MAKWVQQPFDILSSELEPNCSVFNTSFRYSFKAVFGVHVPKRSLYWRPGMPQDHDNDWPSFETVLHDVATGEPGQSAKSDASSHDHVHSSSPNEGSLATIDRSATVETAPPAVSILDEEQSRPVFTEPTETNICSEIVDLLPAPLPPLEIDTSAVRALLMPKGSETETFALDALEPLEAIEHVEAPSFFDDEPAAQSAFSGVDAEEVAGEPAFSSVDEPPSVFDMAFDGGAFADVAFDPDAYAPVSLDDVVADVTPTTPSDADGLIAGAVFELDAESFPDVEPVSPSDDFVPPEETDQSTPTIDLFDLQIPEDEFDSVATANAIEGELNEINDLLPDFSLDESEVDDDDDDLFNLDNVVQLHPDISSEKGSDSGVDWFNPVEEAEPDALPHGTEAVNDAPPATRVSHTGWVGLETVPEPPAPEVEEVLDPWAHMRPDEETEPAGFWSKFFGGDDRKRAKARRRQAQRETTSPTDETVESGVVAFDSACPNCGGECQVDLDDPIGRRVHVSCPECDHMWFTPYLESEAG